MTSFVCLQPCVPGDHCPNTSAEVPCAEGPCCKPFSQHSSCPWLATCPDVRGKWSQNVVCPAALRARVLLPQHLSRATLCGRPLLQSLLHSTQALPLAGHLPGRSQHGSTMTVSQNMKKTSKRRVPCSAVRQATTAPTSQPSYLVQKAISARRSPRHPSDVPGWQPARLNLERVALHRAEPCKRMCACSPARRATTAPTSQPSYLVQKDTSARHFLPHPSAAHGWPPALFKLSRTLALEWLKLMCACSPARQGTTAPTSRPSYLVQRATSARRSPRHPSDALGWQPARPSPAPQTCPWAAFWPCPSFWACCGWPTLAFQPGSGAIRQTHTQSLVAGCMPGQVWLRRPVPGRLFGHVPHSGPAVAGLHCPVSLDQVCPIPHTCSR